MSTTTTNLSLFKYNDDDDNLNFDYRLALNNNWDILDSVVNGKQSTLISGSNIKTINGESILGTGNLLVGNSAITVDSLLNSSSENPIQNKVLYPSLSNFIPAGTVINIKADGSGDFPTLQDAVNFIEYKWSNGEIIIKLNAGIHTLSSSVTIYCQRFNFPKLHIFGDSRTTTFLTGAELIIRDAGTPVMVEDITFYQAGGTTSSNNRRLQGNLQATIRLLECIFDGTYAYFNGSSFSLVSDCSFKNSKYALGCQSGTTVNLSGSHSFDTVDTCFFIRYGGNFSLQNPTMTFTNTNIKFRLWDKAYSYNPSAGLCFYSDGDGTIAGKFSLAS